MDESVSTRAPQSPAFRGSKLEFTVEETDLLGTSRVGGGGVPKKQDSEVPLVNICLYKQAIIILSCLNLVKYGDFSLPFICNAGSPQTACCHMKCGLSNIGWFQIHLKNDFKPLNMMLCCLLPMV